MIGHHSTPELGAASFVNNMFNLGIIFCTGFSYGLTPVIGEFYGSKKFHEAGAALKSSLLANTLVGLLLTLLFYILYLNVGNLGQPAELIPLIKPYYLTLLASLVFIMLFNGFKTVCRRHNRYKNSHVDFAGGQCHEHHRQLPAHSTESSDSRDGFAGCRISTLFSRIAMLAAFVWIFFLSKRYTRYKIGFFRSVRLSGTFRRLNALGWPIGLQMGMETASFN
jgi:MATE family multidrug resistance protein